MYPVFRRLDVLFAMQDYPAAGLGTLYHVALKKEAVPTVSNLPQGTSRITLSYRKSQCPS